MTDRPPPRGRGSILLEALKRKKAEQEKLVGIHQEAPVEEPPKLKGRAAYLKQLQEARLKKVGAEPSSIATKSEPVSLGTELRQQVSEKELENVSQSISKLSCSVREAVTYRGKYFIFCHNLYNLIIIKNNCCA